MSGRWRFDGFCEITDEDHEQGDACAPFTPHSHRGTQIKWAREWPVSDLEPRDPYPEGLTLNEYQAIAVSTAADLTLSPITLATLGLGMAGEGGEVADRIKKVIGHGHPLTDDEKLLIIKEIGDAIWYAAALSHVLGYQLSEVARLNWVKLAARYPNGFTTERSLNRVNE